MQVFVTPERAVKESFLWITRRQTKLKHEEQKSEGTVNNDAFPLCNFALSGNLELQSKAGLHFRLSFKKICAIPLQKQSNHETDMGRENLVNALPKLTLYFTKKKPKKRMVDIEESGIFIPMNVNREKEMTLNEYLCDQSSIFFILLKDKGIFTSDLIFNDVVGIVVVKRKNEHPRTEEPIVLGYGTFSSDDVSYEFPNIKGLIGDKKHEIRNFQQPLNSKGTYDLIHYYEQCAKNVWRLLKLSDEEELSYLDFKFALDTLNIIILEGRARLLFESSDLDKSDSIDITEFEIVLMMNDYILSECNEVINSTNCESNSKEIILTPFDVFSAFQNEHGTITLVEFKECIQLLGYEEFNDEMLSQLFSSEFENEDESFTTMNYEIFLKVWCFKIANPVNELHKYGVVLIDDHKHDVLSKVKTFARNNNPFTTNQLRCRLLNIIGESDKKLLDSFAVAREKVVQIRAESRIRSDEEKGKHKTILAKQRRKHLKEKFSHDRDKRAFILKEQKMRPLKRREEKILKDKVENERKLAQIREEKLISMAWRQKEKLFQKEIRQRGDDRIIIQDERMKSIPEELYVGNEARSKLYFLIMMDFSNNELKELPERHFFFYLSSLRKLCLSCNQILSIPCEISNLGSLEILLLDYNNLQTLPIEIQYLKKLIYFNCSGNRLSSLPREISELSNLKVLIAHSNQMTELPAEISELRNLQILDVSRNKLNYIPSSVSVLVNLTNINISLNSICFLPENFGQLISVELLDISCNIIQVLPKSMKQMKKLMIFKANCNAFMSSSEPILVWEHMLDLQIDENELTLFPKEVRYLIALQRLSISKNKIQDVPVEISFLSELIELDLQSNIITNITVEISRLTSLQIINMTNNKIKELPNELGMIHTLRTIKLSNNQLVCLPKTFKHLSNIEEIDFSHNQLSDSEHIQSIMDLSTIRFLNLSHNNITEIAPQQIENLVNLEILDLSHNKIQSIPAQIKNDLTNLHTINLSKNNVQSFPCFILLSVTNIQHLDLSFNYIDILPVELMYLKNLAFLNLSQNKLSDDENISLPEDIDCFLKEIPSLNIGNQRHNIVQK